jgi:D-3-phosphoglycerate dehydrogenase / 2-oxoglutarate reductase
VEAPLEGTFIYLRNLDVPGVVGRIGTVLGQHNVNIANFSLGRSRQGQEASAVAVVQVDGEISDKVLDALRDIETILLAKAIRFAAPQPKTVLA